MINGNSNTGGCGITNGTIFTIATEQGAGQSTADAAEKQRQEQEAANKKLSDQIYGSSGS